MQPVPAPREPAVETWINSNLFTIFYQIYVEFQLKIFIIHYKFYFFQEEDLSKLVECMALNSNSTSSESESEVSEVSQNILEDDSLLVTISIKHTETISS